MRCNFRLGLAAALVFAMVCFSYPLVSQQSLDLTRISSPINQTNLDQLDVLSELSTGFVNDLTWSNDGRILAVAGVDKVYLFDLEDINLSPRVLELPPLANSIAFSPDDTLISVSSGNMREPEDSFVKIYDSKTLVERVTLRIAHATTSGSEADGSLRIYSTVIEDMIFSSAGNYLITAGWDSYIRIWDVSTGHEVTNLRGQNVNYALTWLRDNRLFVSGGVDGAVQLWDVTKNAEVNTLWVDENVVYSLAANQDGTKMATGTGSGVRVWDLTSETEHAFTNSDYTIYDIEFSVDGNVLFSIQSRNDGNDSTEIAVLLKALDLQGGTETLIWQSAIDTTSTYSNVDNIALNPSGSILAIETTERSVQLLAVRD